MTRRVDEIFLELIEIEESLGIVDLNAIELSIWGYLRPRIFDMLSNDVCILSRTKSGFWVTLFRLLNSLVCCLSLLFNRRKYNDIYFMSGRFDSTNQDLYFGKNSGLKNALKLNYSPAIKFCAYKGVCDIFYIKILFLLLVKSRLCGVFISKERKISLCKIQELLESILSSDQVVPLLRKVEEYFLWLVFFSWLHRKFEAKIYHVVSNNFFIPLIFSVENEAKVFEYSHAFVHCYHYAYVYPWLKKRSYVLPHKIIETPYSKTNGVCFPSDLQLQPISEKKTQYENKNSRKVLIVSQPGVARVLYNWLSLISDMLSDFDVCWCNHPLERGYRLTEEQEEALPFVIRYVDGETYSEIKDSFLVCGDHSNLLLEAARAGITTVVFDNFYAPALNSVSDWIKVVQSREDFSLLLRSKSE